MFSTTGQCAAARCLIGANKARYTKRRYAKMSITLNFAQEPRAGLEIALMRNEVINCREAQARTKYLSTLPCLPIRVQLNSEHRSRRRAVVVPKQSTEYAVTSHSARVWCDFGGRAGT